MGWAKLDDRFHSHPKALRAWKREPAAVGLHALALSWVAAHETDGRVPPEWVSQLLPNDETQARAVETLVGSGLWERNGDGFVIHDYVDWNPSHEDMEDKRRRDRETARERRRGGGR